MKKIIYTFGILAVLMLFSCKKDGRTPYQMEMDKAIATDNLLQDNKWGFKDLKINIQYEVSAPSILANVADENGMVQAGTYDANDIFGNGLRQEYYLYEFINGKVNRDTSGTGNYSKHGFYTVMSAEEIWINPENAGFMKFEYSYQEGNGIFLMSAGQGQNEKVINVMNKIITKSILAGRPGDIANIVIDKLLDSEKVSGKINQILYDLIHGKIEEISKNPEYVAGKLAPVILNKLKEVEWESIVESKLIEILEALKIDDPQAKATEMAITIANMIETSISEGNIYNVILPILQEFENETLPTLAPVLSEAIYNLISNVLTEERIYDRIYPVWTKYTEMDSTSIKALGDTLGTVVTNKLFDTVSMATRLMPFMEELDGTSVIKLPGMAQDIIDDALKPIVDTINARFPGAEIDPNWALVKTGLTAALTTLKTTIGNGGNAVAEASASLAKTIITLMDVSISKGFKIALFKLQDIPADQASITISAWIINLIGIAEEPIVEFLTEKLEELIDLFNAEAVAEQLATLIHNKITEIFSVDKISDLIYPLLVKFNDMNSEIAAEKISEWLFDIDIVRVDLDEEQVIEKLTVILSELLSNLDVDKSSQLLTDLILNSDIVSNIDGSLLKRVLELKIYQFFLKIERQINAIDKVEISLIIK